MGRHESTDPGKQHRDATSEGVSSVPREMGHQPVALKQISGFRDKVTYTFQQDDEVGCIHFDAMRDEIFFNGHNVKNIELTEKHWALLEDFSRKLKQEKKLRSAPYSRALKHLYQMQGKRHPNHPLDK